MPQKKIDSRIPALVRNGVQTNERSFIIMVGDKSRNQLPNLHYLLTSADPHANKNVLWAYKKKLLGFTSHRKKRETKIKREIKRGTREVNQQDPFELFISLQNIRYVYYKETDKILGNTYGMLILQDFEAMTPNILARTIETVQGGGLVVLLLQSMKSLKQLYSMTMDVHSRYRTEARDDVVARFNERFILSLQSNRNCLVVDDELNVLPISGARGVKALPPPPADEQKEDTELTELVNSLEGVRAVYPLVKMCKTVDQARAILTFVDAVSDKTLRQTVSLTAGRGRGKSAAMGLAIASAIAHGYSNIFITSPSPENLKTLFEFVFKGFDALGFEEHQDYDIIQSTNPEFNKAIVRVNVFKTHRQTLQWIQPSDSQVLGQAELVVIDEAAAIPLPLVKKLLGPYLVFMASTINGYEGTGRSLSLKLLSQLRSSSGGADRKLREITLSEPIRYASGDPVEKWLNKLLCLDATAPSPSGSSAGLGSGYPHPNDCELYSINRNTLFSFHPVSEAFLHKVMGLYVASHYKNSPNDLQLLSDAPAHQLFVLLAPQKKGATTLPEPLCVIQLALEGQISKRSMAASLAAGQRGGGDLIPWVVSQQFQDTEFASLSGGRVVRIATNPDYVGMGYGARAMDQLARFFKGEFTPLHEGTELFKADFELNESRVSDSDLGDGNLAAEELRTRDPRSMPPLLMRLSEMQPEPLDYLGVSYGMTQSLFRFWKRQQFLPLYLRQTTNDLTGEHTCIMIRALRENDTRWLTDFSTDFGHRAIELLAYNFRTFPAVQALVLLQSVPAESAATVSKHWLDEHYSPFDLKRLDSYAQGRIDHHVITDLIPSIAEAYFRHEMGDEVALSSVQQAVLLGMGLQKKEIGEVGAELNLPSNQALAMFNKTMRKVSGFYRKVLSNEINAQMPEIKDGLDDDDLVAHEDARDGVKMSADNEDDKSESESEGPEESAGDSADEEKTEEDREAEHKRRELINALDLKRYEISNEAEFDADTVERGAKHGKVAVKQPSKKRRENMDDIYKEEIAKTTKKPKKGKKA